MVRYFWNNKGFSLIEVVSLLVIIGILTAVAASNGISTQQDLISQMDIMKSHLRFAQLKALQDDTATWGIAFSGNAYTLYRTPPIIPTSNLTGIGTDTYTFPPGITVNTVSVDFNSSGSPIAGATSIVLSQNSMTKTINLSANTGFITP